LTGDEAVVGFSSAFARNFYKNIKYTNLYGHDAPTLQINEETDG